MLMVNGQSMKSFEDSTARTVELLKVKDRPLVVSFAKNKGKRQKTVAKTGAASVSTDKSGALFDVLDSSRDFSRDMSFIRVPEVSSLDPLELFKSSNTEEEALKRADDALYTPMGGGVKKVSGMGTSI